MDKDKTIKDLEAKIKELNEDIAYLKETACEKICAHLGIDVEFKDLSLVLKGGKFRVESENGWETNIFIDDKPFPYFTRLNIILDANRTLINADLSF